ncbi:bacteriohemerythrin [Azospirillum himalayense]|uniref:Bacteriohemerythrin n=1 Tax=Azospirillum himalayense TaxID=654847 RepID=A0ABW0G6Y8_9PROT
MEWDAAYAIGQSAVDADHQRLFQLFNQFSAAIAAGETRESANRFLRELADYSAYHFRREEGLMHAVGYPDYAKHKTMHDTFADFVRRQSDSGARDPEEVQFLQSYVEMWLCGHILVMDKWFGEWLDGRGEKAGTVAPTA